MRVVVLAFVTVCGAGALKKSLFRLRRCVFACRVGERLAQQQRNAGGVRAVSSRLEPLEENEAGFERRRSVRTLGRMQLLPAGQIAAGAGRSLLRKRGLVG